MSENVSSSKGEQMVFYSGRDKLSELPSSIIHIILSSLSTRDAVRMSILSRQYRYSWISLPHLVFNLSEFSSKEHMEKFVTNVLKLRKGPILKFGISAQLKKSWPIVDEWLLFLPTNEIRELILHFCSIWLQVRSIVYSCNKLTRLELKGCKLGPPPLTFTGFLFLRCLILVNVFMYLKDFESIVADSPLLETLKLHGCCCDGVNIELKISAPSLKYLDLESNPWDCIRLYLYTPLLAEMSVSISYMDNRLLELLLDGRTDCSYVNFLGGGNSVQKWKGSYFIKDMGYGINSWQYSFVLPCLKVIELKDVKYGVVKHISIIARLVTGAPNLQELKLKCDYEEEEEEEEDASDSDLNSEAPDVSYMDFLSAPSFKWEQLKNITVSSFTVLPSMIQFLKLLLENSPALERMNLHTSLLDEEYVRSEVLKCNIPSPNFTISIS